MPTFAGHRTIVVVGITSFAAAAPRPTKSTVQEADAAT
jgi:hypothetical protein